MARVGKIGDNHRDGAVKSRSQVLNTKTGLWVKRDDTDGKFMDVKTTTGKFKAVRREKIPALKTQVKIKKISAARKSAKKK